MKKGVFAILLLVAISITSCKDAKKDTTDPKTTEAKVSVKEKLALVTFQCPMKCEKEKVYTKAGSCPICKMDLKEVKVTATQDSHEGHNH